MSYFDDNEDEITGLTWARGCRRSYPQDHDVTCDRCGADGLKWRLNDAGDWRLYEDERIEGNRKKLHECNPACADDFGVLE